jgi:hypothetical protein
MLASKISIHHSTDIILVMNKHPTDEKQHKIETNLPFQRKMKMKIFALKIASDITAHH